MKAIDFPKTSENPILYWLESTGEYIALVETEETIVLYRWDGFSESWNERLVFSKVTARK